MKTIQEHMNEVKERNKKIMENQKKYHWRNMSDEKKKQTLKINLTTNTILLIVCIAGLILFKAFWMISLLIICILSLGVNCCLIYKERKGL